MPKRPVTPEHEQDEYKYFTVYRAFPLHPNWELPGDRLNFARWIACIVGQHNLIALYHKPKARNTVIIEVKKAMGPLLETKLLGEHKWNKLLKNPTEEEARLTSKIYYCTYPHARAAQKEGWKRVFVQDSWFLLPNGQPFLPENNRLVVSPYPASVWCEVPPEDRTNKPLCSPIPRKMFGVITPVAPVPGSIKWLQSKSAVQIPSKAIPPGNTVLSKTSVPFSTDMPQSQSNGNQGDSYLAVNSRPLAQKPAQLLATLPPGLTANSNSSSSTSSGSSPCSTTLSADFDDLAVTVTLDEDEDVGDSVIYPWETAKQNVWPGDEPRSATVVSIVDEQEPMVNLWAETISSEPGKDSDEELICPAHGSLCKKGICAEKAKLVRRKEARDRAAGKPPPKGPWNGKVWGEDVSKVNRLGTSRQGRSDGGMFFFFSPGLCLLFWSSMH
ncbi:hypothetical protein DL96DRAFT_1575887 [Flagelloscypha sp. PMI_526]|nr:hypothetical protein DL96DRAFT_1575887 [Flagelloscypha sp. PMI_526]